MAQLMRDGGDNRQMMMAVNIRCTPVIEPELFEVRLHRRVFRSVGYHHVGASCCLTFYVPHGTSFYCACLCRFGLRVLGSCCGPRLGIKAASLQLCGWVVGIAEPLTNVSAMLMATTPYQAFHCCSHTDITV